MQTIKQLTIISLSLIILSSCASHKYSDTQRKLDRTVIIDANISDYNLIFSKLSEGMKQKVIIQKNANSTVLTLPSLSKKYRIVEISSPNFNSEFVTIKKVPRIKAIGNDILAGMFSFGLPFLIDPFRSDFYKIPKKSKSVKINLSHSQEYMASEFNKIANSSNLKDFNDYISKFPGSNLKQTVIDKKDSIELDIAFSKEKEDAIDEFILNHPNSKYLGQAKDIQQEMVFAKKYFEDVSKTNNIEGYSSFIQKFPKSIYTKEVQRRLVDVSISKILTINDLIEIKKIFIENIQQNINVFQIDAFNDKFNNVIIHIQNVVSKSYLNSKAKDKYAMYSNLWNQELEIYNWFTNDFKPSFPIFETHRNQICSFLTTQIIGSSTKEKQTELMNKLGKDFKRFDLSGINSNIIAQVLIHSNSLNGDFKLYNVNFMKYYLDQVSERNPLKGIDMLIYRDSVRDILSNIDFEEIHFVNGSMNGINKFKGNGKDFLILDVKSGTPTLAKYFDNSNLILESHFTTSSMYSFEFENGKNITILNLEVLFQSGIEAKNNGEYEKAKKILTVDCKNELPENLEINKKIKQSINSIENDKWKYYAEKYLRDERKFIVGKEGMYGVTLNRSDNSYTEGILEKEGYISMYGVKPGNIIIEHDLNGKIKSIKGWIKNNEIDFSYDYKNNPRIMYTSYDNAKNKAIETLYESTRKGVWYYKNGSYDRQTQEEGNYNILSIAEEEAKKARQNLPGFNVDSLSNAQNIIRAIAEIGGDFDLNQVKKYVAKSSFTKEEASNIYSVYLLAFNKNLKSEATTLILKHLEINGSGYGGSNYYYVGMHYQNYKLYKDALVYYKKWEAELLKEDIRGDIDDCYKLLSDCYLEVKDQANSNLYLSKYQVLQPKINNEQNDEVADWRIYCYSTYQGDYKLKLDDKSKNVKYILYKGTVPTKVMTGTWMLRDEGIYGTAYMLTITWNGENSNFPEMKFVAQYDGFGELQGLIDSQNRTWNKCK